MDADFFDQLKGWGFDTSQFQATEFTVVDLIHPDDVITQPKSDRIAYRIVERGTSDHTIDQGMKRLKVAIESCSRICTYIVNMNLFTSLGKDGCSR